MKSHQNSFTQTDTFMKGAHHAILSFWTFQKYLEAEGNLK